ncbi:MAG: RsmD family RNA methyltransferase, partial [Opitutales bacterium]|nr:RsmD family RNA methyltransferase [Opitutales bacterium]
MRISSGKARGIVLVSPRGDATRPATDAARQAIFSSVGGAV